MPNRVQQLVLPLANQRLGNDEEDALRPFGPALRDDETGLDGLAEADFVRKDATALAQTPERENHGVDLVWVWIDSRLTLGCRIALAVVGSRIRTRSSASIRRLKLWSGIDRHPFAVAAATARTTVENKPLASMRILNKSLNTAPWPQGKSVQIKYSS